MVSCVWPWLTLRHQLVLELSAVIREERGSNVPDGALESEERARRSDLLTTVRRTLWCIAGTKATEKPNLKSERWNLKRLSDTLRFTLRCVWVREHRKAAEWKQPELSSVNMWQNAAAPWPQRAWANAPSQPASVQRDLSVRAASF